MTDKRLTPLQTVKEKCKDCCGTLKDARVCEATNCALWHHRAGKKDGEQTKTASKALKAYCIQCCNGNAKEVNLCTAVNCPIYMLKRQKEAEKVAKEKE